MAMMDLINRVYKTLPQGARAQLLLCDAVFLLYTFSEHLKREEPMGLVTGKEILGPARDLITEIVREKVRLFGSAGKAQEVK
jgi:hypothetical protein